MKKIFAAVLSLSLALSMSVTVFAEGGSATVGEPTEQPIEVYAKYVKGSSDAAVYSVDIVWDDMTFVYTETGTRIWDPTTHTYSEATTGGWDKTAANLKVTNHSNKMVDVVWEYTPVEGTGITQFFSGVRATLERGYVDQYDRADSSEVTLTIGGTPTDYVTEQGVQIGNITVTISAHN